MPKSGFTAKVEDQALERAKGCCEYCGGTLKNRYEFDHRRPRALGGDNSLENCAVSCLPCHNTKTVEEDRPAIGKADRKGKTTKRLEVAVGVSEIARRFGVTQ